jgi:hypothetical protein
MILIVLTTVLIMSAVVIIPYEPLYSIKYGELLDQLINYKLPRKEYAPLFCKASPSATLNSVVLRHILQPDRLRRHGGDGWQPSRFGGRTARGTAFHSGNSLSIWEQPFTLGTAFHSGNSLTPWEQPFNLGTAFQSGNSLSPWEQPFNLGTAFHPGNSLSIWEQPFTLGTASRDIAAMLLVRAVRHRR